MTEYQASERRGCRIMGISRSLLHYCPNTARDIPVVEVLQKLAHQYPAYGFGLMFNKLRQSGLPWNVKRVYRVYRLLVTNGAIVIHTQRLKSDPGGNLLS